MYSVVYNDELNIIACCLLTLIIEYCVVLSIILCIVRYIYSLVFIYRPLQIDDKIVYLRCVSVIIIGLI